MNVETLYNAYLYISKLTKLVKNKNDVPSVVYQSIHNKDMSNLYKIQKFNLESEWYVTVKVKFSLNALEVSSKCNFKYNGDPLNMKNRAKIAKFWHIIQ